MRERGELGWGRKCNVSRWLKLTRKWLNPPESMTHLGNIKKIHLSIDEDSGLSVLSAAFHTWLWDIMKQTGVVRSALSARCSQMFSEQPPPDFRVWLHVVTYQWRKSLHILSRQSSLCDPLEPTGRQKANWGWALTQSWLIEYWSRHTEPEQWHLQIKSLSLFLSPCPFGQIEQIIS